MGAFEYTALDTTGKERSGVLEGDAARQIRQQLREQGLTPLSVEEVQQREKRSRGTLLKRKISASDLALISFCQEFNAHSGILVDILFGSGYAGLGKLLAPSSLRPLLLERTRYLPSSIRMVPDSPVSSTGHPWRNA